MQGCGINQGKKEGLNNDFEYAFAVTRLMRLIFHFVDCAQFFEIIQTKKPENDAEFEF